jgi:adenylate kinase
MAENLTIRKVHFVDREQQVVEVKARAGSAPRDYTVHFDRHGVIKFGHGYVPDLGYLDPESIPSVVKQAAFELYQKDNKQ